MRNAITGLCLAALVGAAAPALANDWQTIEERDFGQWTYAERFNVTSGQSSCQIATFFPDGAAVHLVANSEHGLTLTLAASRPPVASRAAATISIDGDLFTATFERREGNRAVARIGNADAGGRFLERLALGNVMRIDVVGGASFSVGLRGSLRAMDAMDRCVGRMA